jgi:hypothetical protein
MKNLKVSTPSIDGVSDISHNWMLILLKSCGLNPYYPKPFKDIHELMQFAEEPAESLKGIDPEEDPDRYTKTHKRILLRKFLKQCTIIRTNSGRIVGYDPTGEYDNIIEMVREAFGVSEITMEHKEIAIHTCWIIYWHWDSWEKDQKGLYSDRPKAWNNLGLEHGYCICDYKYSVSLERMMVWDALKYHSGYGNDKYYHSTYICGNYMFKRAAAIIKLEDAIEWKYRILMHSDMRHHYLFKDSNRFAKKPDSLKLRRATMFHNFIGDNIETLTRRFYMKGITDIRIRRYDNHEPNDYLSYAAGTGNGNITVRLQTLKSTDWQLDVVKGTNNTYETHLILPKDFTVDYLRTTAHPDQLTDKDIEAIYDLARALESYHVHVYNHPWILKKLQGE